MGISHFIFPAEMELQGWFCVPESYEMTSEECSAWKSGIKVEMINNELLAGKLNNATFETECKKVYTLSNHMVPYYY